MLARREVVDRVLLKGLERDEVGELITAASGTQPTPAIVTNVHNRTEGNPFFVSELVRLMAGEHAMDEASEVILSGAIPAGVGDVISRRLARLPQGTKSLVVLASVLGRQFGLREVATAAGRDLDQIVEDIEPAILDGVLIEDHQVMGQLRFSHALVQETVYAGLTMARRARLHARVGRALEELYGGDDDEHAPELARHFFLAGEAETAECAFHHALRAADASMARFAYDQAQVHLDRGLGALSRLPATPERDRRELDVQTRRTIVLALTRGASAAEVADACSRAHELSSRLGDSNRLTASLWSLWTLSVMRAEFEPAVALGHQMEV